MVFFLHSVYSYSAFTLGYSYRIAWVPLADAAANRCCHQQIYCKLCPSLITMPAKLK